MHPQRTLLFLLGLISFANALALPTAIESWTESTRELFKRKGGGGGGGRGGGGGGSSGGSRGSGGSSSSGRTSPSSNAGGSTAAGSGTPRGYGGSAYYGGGGGVPYTSGPGARRGVTPYLLGGAAFAFFPGIWLYSVYAYSWPGYYHWRNSTTNQNETGPINCLCQQYSVCGCDQNNNSDYLNQVANNKSIAYRADNGTLYINGTLPNGTTAPGGEGAAVSLKQGVIQNSGYWIVIAGVTYAVSFL